MPSAYFFFFFFFYIYVDVGAGSTWIILSRLILQLHIFFPFICRTFLLHLSELTTVKTMQSFIINHPNQLSSFLTYSTWIALHLFMIPFFFFLPYNCFRKIDHTLWKDTTITKPALLIFASPTWSTSVLPNTDKRSRAGGRIQGHSQLISTHLAHFSSSLCSLKSK